MDIVRDPKSKIFRADKEFAYGADNQKIYALDNDKNLLDLKTGEKIGKWLIPTSLLNTPGYPTSPDFAADDIRLSHKDDQH